MRSPHASHLPRLGPGPGAALRFQQGAGRGMVGQRHAPAGRALRGLHGAGSLVLTRRTESQRRERIRHSRPGAVPWGVDPRPPGALLPARPRAREAGGQEPGRMAYSRRTRPLEHRPRERRRSVREVLRVLRHRRGIRRASARYRARRVQGRDRQEHLGGSPLRVTLRRRRLRVKNAVYELRALPPLTIAANDPRLAHLMADKVIANWPTEAGLNDAKGWGKALNEGAVIKSLSIAYRNDGAGGLVWSFPFFIVKHLNDQMTGGYILQRMCGR